MNRMVSKDLPNGGFFEYDILYTFDNRGLMLSAVQSNGHAVRYSYDNAGRVLSEGSDHYGAKTFLYDGNGNRTRITHRDGVFFQYDHDGLDRVVAIRENGAASGVGVLATFAYDALGRRASLTRGNGTVTSYAYDGASRLASLAQDLAGSGHDLSLTFSHNPASQIVSNTRSNDLYAWTGHGSGTIASTANGLNQLASLGGATLAYDARGNLTNDGARTFNYTSENKLHGMNGQPALAYDGVGRAYYNALNGHWSDYDGDRLVAEIYHPTNSITRRYVHGPGVDEPLVWYEIGDTTPRRWLHADERGSIIAITNDAGQAIATHKYDEYGKPGNSLGRFLYTGQVWLPEIGVYYYKNRMYDPNLRFLQADPLGYYDGMNRYAYVRNDPVNFIDPLGLGCEHPNIDNIICGIRPKDDHGSTGGPQGWGRSVGGVGGGGGGGGGIGRKRPQPEPQSSEGRQCSIVRGEKGEIQAKGVSVTGVLGLGITVTKGTFRNVRTGSTGSFVSYGLGAGLLGGVSETHSTFRDIGSFVGFSDNASYGFPVPFASRIGGVGSLLSRIGIGGSQHRNLEGQRVGASSDAGLGESGILTRIGVAGTLTETVISNCKPGQN